MRDDDFDQPTNLLEFVQVMSLLYYGVDYDSTLHADQLILPFRSVLGANPYLFPDQSLVDTDLLSRVRMRLAVGPNIRVNFTSKKMLQQLGFSPETRVQYRFPFENTNTRGFEYFVADTFPLVTDQLEGGKNFVTSVATTIFKGRKVQLSQADLASNKKLETILGDCFKQVSEETNVRLSLKYDKPANMFKINFPANPNVFSKLTGEVDLFSRLGYGAVTEVDKNSKSVAQVAQTKEISNKAKILCLDTGQVVVSALNVSSNLSITGHTYLGSLFPQASMLEMPAAQIQYQNSVVPLDFEGGQVNAVPFHCLLQKFNQLGQLSPFVWPTGAYVSGILRGKV